MDYKLWWGVRSNCDNYAIKDDVQWAGGHGVWVEQPDHISNNSGQFLDTDDSPSGCYGLHGYVYDFFENSIPFGSGPYAVMDYWNGSSCSQFGDTQDVVDYYWGY